MPTPFKVIHLGDTEFKIGPIDADESFDLQPRIFPVIAEVMASIVTMIKAAPPEDRPEGADPDGAEREMLNKRRMTIGALGRAAQKLQIEKMDADGIVPIVARVCAQLPPDELRAIRRVLLSNSFANGERLYARKPGEKGCFSEVMQGRTIDTWRVMYEAFRVVFADFFDRLSASLGKLAAEGGRTEGSTTSQTAGPSTV